MNATKSISVNDFISRGIRVLSLIERLDIDPNDLVVASVSQWDATIHLLGTKFDAIRIELGPLAEPHEYGDDWFTFDGVRFCR